MTSITWQPDRFLDLDLVLARHNRWGRDVVNIFREGTYFRVAGGGDVYSARQNGSIEVTSRNPVAALGDFKYRLAESLPYEPVQELADRDPYVSRLADDFAGYRPPLVVDPFEMLVGAIAAQQVNLRWATTVKGRLIEHYGQVHRVAGIDVWEFPRPERVADSHPEVLRRLQFTRAKSEAIIRLAKAASAGELEGLHDLTNREVIDLITEMRGIGRWTADWLLARGLGRADVVAAGDLGIRKAVSHLYLSEDDLQSEEVVREVTAEWGDAANWTAHLLLERLARPTDWTPQRQS